MSILDGTYSYIYVGCEDGWHDEFPCRYDDETHRVVWFGEPTACHSYEDGASLYMTDEEWVHLDDGRDIQAMKEPEFTDMVQCDHEEWPAEMLAAGQLAIFDDEMLREAMERSVFAKEAYAKSVEGLDFRTCKPSCAAGIHSSTDEAANDAHDAREHLRRAIRTMGRVCERSDGYAAQYGGPGYRAYADDTRDLLRRLEEAEGVVAKLAEELRRFNMVEH